MMNLHEAMTEVLRRQKGWVDREEIARVIAEEGLYVRRSDSRPPPDDQLRLRARRYPRLFECADASCTRIRLRSDGLTKPRTQARSIRPPKTTGAGGTAPSVVSEAARTAARRRTQAAQRFKPGRVDVLLVAESPPSALDRYFYFLDVREHDSLFRYVARGILGVEPTRDNKEELLGKLKERGVFLIDLKLDPTDASPLGKHVTALVDRIRRLRPQRIVLIKASVYDATHEALAAAGLPVVDQRVPFPGSGQQRRFEEAFARALKN